MSDKCCTQSGELRVMIDEAAEKAATRVADKLASELKVEILNRDKELRVEISEMIDQKFRDYFGMTPQQHLVEHSQIKLHLEFLRSIWVNIGKKLGLAIILGSLAFIGASTKDIWSAKTVPALTRDEKTEKDRFGEIKP